MNSNNLPTEVLCSIFQIAVTDSEDCRLWSSDCGVPSRNQSMLGGFCSLPSLRQTFGNSLSISQVCVRWRGIAIGTEGLWAHIYLGSNTFKGFLISRNILSRSQNRDLYLEMELDRDLVPADIQDGESIDLPERLLKEHIWRCRALRIVANGHTLGAILDVFMDHNLSGGASVHHDDQASLSRLHVLQLQSRVNAEHPIFPPDLSLIAPHVAGLRIESFHVSGYPRWHLQNVAIVDTFLSYRSFHHLLEKTRTLRLVLDQVTIPAGEPYVRNMQARPSSITSLAISNPRCSGREDNQASMYAMFFTLILISCPQELELSELNEIAMEGWINALRIDQPAAYVDLHRLVLRSVRFGHVGVLAMARSLTHIRELVLDDVGGSSTELFKIWGNQGLAVWPMLTEISLDGQIVGR